jgi:hypothetical protein
MKTYVTMWFYIDNGLFRDIEKSKKIIETSKVCVHGSKIGVKKGTLLSRPYTVSIPISIRTARPS